MRGTPLPATDSTEPLWRSASGALVVGRCGACEQLHHYPRPVCPRCGATDTSLVEVSGRGRVVSWTVSRTSPAPRLPVPAFVELEEGLTLLTRLADVVPELVKIDMPVSVVFREGELGGAPQFVPAAG